MAQGSRHPCAATRDVACPWTPTPASCSRTVGGRQPATVGSEAATADLEGATDLPELLFAYPRYPIHAREPRMVDLRESFYLSGGLFIR